MGGTDWLADVTDFEPPSGLLAIQTRGLISNEDFGVLAPWTLLPKMQRIVATTRDDRSTHLQLVRFAQKQDDGLFACFPLRSVSNETPVYLTDFVDVNDQGPPFIVLEVKASLWDWFEMAFAEALEWIKRDCQRVR